MEAAAEESPAARDQPRADALAKAAAGGVLVLTAMLFFARIGARALWSSEGRWAEIAREMRISGNYLWPTINGRLYYDKPLLSYWLVLGAARLTGSLNEAAARIPCAFAGVLGVAMLILLARRLYDWRTGAIAGFILATSMSFIFFSRHASADVDTISGELAALLLFVANLERPDGWWVVMVLWLVMAITSLTKGLLGFVLPILVIGGYSCLKTGWREAWDHLARGALGRRAGWLIERNRWVFNWWSLPAIGLAAVVYFVPFALSAYRMHSNAGLRLVYEENLVRFFHPFDHRGPIYLYVYVIFALMAPWSALLPAALSQAHRRDRPTGEDEGIDRFALVYFWATFIFFTLSGSRRSYYILPILPAGALLVARLLTQRASGLSPLAKRLLAVGYLAVAIIVIAAAAMLMPPWMRPGPWRTYPKIPALASFAVLWAVSLAAICYGLARMEPRRIAVSVGIVAYLSMTYLYLFAMPAAEVYRGEKPFGIEVRNELHGQFGELGLFRTQGPLFYLDSPHPIPDYHEPSAVREAVEHGKIKWLIVKRRDLPLLGLLSTTITGEATFPWEDARDIRSKEIMVRVGPDSHR